MRDSSAPRHSLIAVLLLGFALPSLATAQSTRPAGLWRLDVARSDTLRTPFHPRNDSTAAPPTARPGEGPGYGAPGAGGAGGPGGVGGGMEGGRRYGGGRYGRGMTDKDLERIRQTLGLARKAPMQVEIDAGGKKVTFTDQQGFETTVAIDGRATCEPVFDGSDVCTKARWSDEALVIERSVHGGGRVIERYTLGLGAIRLLSFVSVEGVLQPLEFTRQYERGE